ncbi:hypothetical protein RT99_00165 [Flavobacterium sp. MEB061]|nr:hypothetical protein RT99_00165 [Flavobacterium sp. MEB061]
MFIEQSPVMSTQTVSLSLLSNLSMCPSPQPTTFMFVKVVYVEFAKVILTALSKIIVTQQ